MKISKTYTAILVLIGIIAFLGITNLLAVKVHAISEKEKCYAICASGFEGCKASCPMDPLGPIGPAYVSCVKKCKDKADECRKKCNTPDLTIKDWWVTPDAMPENLTNEVEHGQSYKVCFIVANIGMVPSGPFTVSGGGLGISYNPTQSHVSLAPGQVREGCLEYPTTPPPGAYKLGIKADASNVVAESNEKNNERIEDITILHPKKLEKEAEHVAEPVGQPDLVITNIYCSQKNLAFIVKNQGSGYFGKSVRGGYQTSVKVWISPPSNENIIGLDSLNEVKKTEGGVTHPGGSSSFVTPIEIGTESFVEITIDPDNRIRESNENNNVYGRRIGPCEIREHPETKAVPK